VVIGALHDDGDEEYGAGAGDKEEEEWK